MAEYRDWVRWALIAGITVLVIAFELWPGRVTLTPTLLGLIVVVVILVAFPLIEEATLPGGGGFKFRRDLQEAQPVALRLRATAPPVADREGTARLRIAELLRTPPSLALLVRQQPLAGVAAIRSELESKLREACREVYGEAPASTAEMVDRLRADGYITPDQAELALRLVAIANEAIHQGTISAWDANRILELASTLNGSLVDSRIASAFEFHEQVAEVLEGNPDLSVEAEPAPPSQETYRPDFLVERDGSRIVVEVVFTLDRRVLADRLRDAEYRLIRAVESFDAMGGQIVIPDEQSPDPRPQGRYPSIEVLSFREFHTRYSG